MAIVDRNASGRVSLQVLSHSRVSSLRDCPAKFSYRYLEGLRQRVEDPTRIRGRLMHEGLAAGFGTWRDLRMAGAGADDVAAALEEIRRDAARAQEQKYDEYLRALEEARKAGADVEACDESVRALTGALEADRWVVGHFFGRIVPRDFATKRPILIEHPFDVPILDSGKGRRHLRWIGVVDLVMLDERAQLLEVHDHKSIGTNAGSEEHRRRIEGDPQLASYVYALRQMRDSGELDDVLSRVAGRSVTKPGADLFADPTVEPDRAWVRSLPVGVIVVNLLRRKMPAKPKMLADGTISVDSRIDTLPEVYESAIDAAPEPDALRKALEDLEAARQVYTDESEPCTAAERDRRAKRYEKAREVLAKKRASWRETQAKQRALLEAIRSRGDTFAGQLDDFIGADELERWRVEQWVEAARIRRLERHPGERTRNLGFCTAPGRGCGFRSLCYANGDEQIRSREYTTPDEREAMEAEHEDHEEEDAAPAAWDPPSWG